MMAKFKATAEQMRSAAKKLESEALNYENASKAAKEAADQLTSKWEGDAREVFVSEQDRANTWYIQMAQIVRQYAQALDRAAQAYQTADQQAAGEITRR